jgi:hypothetical protein
MLPFVQHDTPVVSLDRGHRRRVRFASGDLAPDVSGAMRRAVTLRAAAAAVPTWVLAASL